MQIENTVSSVRVLASLAQVNSPFRPSPHGLYWPLAILVYQSSKKDSSDRGIFENIYIFWGGGGETGKQKILNTKSKHTNKVTFKAIQQFIISCFQHPYLLVKVNRNKWKKKKL